MSLIDTLISSEFTTELVKFNAIKNSIIEFNSNIDNFKIKCSSPYYYRVSTLAFISILLNSTNTDMYKVVDTNTISNLSMTVIISVSNVLQALVRSYIKDSVPLTKAFILRADRSCRNYLLPITLVNQLVKQEVVGIDNMFIYYSCLNSPFILVEHYKHEEFTYVK